MQVPVVEGVTRETLARAEKLMIVRFTFAKGASVPAHSHPHEQSSYIVRGALQYDIEGRQVVLRPGDALVVPAGAVHSAMALEETVDVNSFTPLREDYL
jgi:quercetin dioxygenase-like cupin family protein